MTSVVFVVYTADFWGQMEVNGRNSVRESSAILISAEFNISPHYICLWSEIKSPCCSVLPCFGPSNDRRTLQDATHRRRTLFLVILLELLLYVQFSSVNSQSTWPHECRMTSITVTRRHNSHCCGHWMDPCCLTVGFCIYVGYPSDSLASCYDTGEVVCPVCRRMPNTTNCIMLHNLGHNPAVYTRAVTAVIRLGAVDRFALSVDRAARLNDHSIAQQSTDGLHYRVSTIHYLRTVCVGRREAQSHR